MNAADETSIVEDLRDWFIEKLIASIQGTYGPSLLTIPDGKTFYTAYSERQIRDVHTTHPKQWTYWKGIQDFPVTLTVAQLMQLIAEYSSRAEQRERVLREALKKMRCNCSSLLPWTCIRCIALATPAPEQNAACSCTHSRSDHVGTVAEGSNAMPCIRCSCIQYKPAQTSSCPDCRSAKTSSRGLLCDGGREWRCDNEWHDQQPAAEQGKEPQI